MVETKFDVIGIDFLVLHEANCVDMGE